MVLWRDYERWAGYIRYPAYFQELECNQTILDFPAAVRQAHLLWASALFYDPIIYVVFWNTPETPACSDVCREHLSWVIRRSRFSSRKCPLPARDWWREYSHAVFASCRSNKPQRRCRSFRKSFYQQGHSSERSFPSPCPSSTSIPSHVRQCECHLSILLCNQVG